MVIGRFELTTSRVQNQSNGRAIVGNKKCLSNDIFW
jgi:hypothetical protein